MALRTLEDSQGRQWEIWDVHPNGIERRQNRERAEELPELAFAAVPRMKFTLPVALRQGWLAFRCEDDARRLAPIPADWENMADDALILLLSAATPARQRVG